MTLNSCHLIASIANKAVDARNVFTSLTTNIAVSEFRHAGDRLYTSLFKIGKIMN